MRILIIGGTNFIGPYVVAALHGSGHEITVYHRGHHEPDLPPDVRHVHSPRAGIPVLHFPSALSDPVPDVVVHMFPVGEDDARAAMARFAGVARRLVALSSGDVYRAYGRLLGNESGPPEPVPLNEAAPLRTALYPYRHMAAGPADWTFHYEKILVERAVLGVTALPGTVLRLPAVYGPGDQYRRLRPYIKRMDDHRPAILLESAQSTWRWTHGYVDDVARAIALAVVNDVAAGKVYNLGEANPPTVAERVRRIGDAAGWKGSIVPLPSARLPAHLRAPYQPRQDLVFDTGRLRDELAYTELLPEEEGLRRTIAWERANPPVTGDPGRSEYDSEDAALR
ncbi:MAG: NAD-dependent epimerase/dehydratase family protein [Gemmatimonadales bacterium]